MTGCTLEKDAHGFSLVGIINFATVPNLYQRGTTLLADFEEIKVDLINVSQANSAALALLLNWIRTAKQQKKTIKFINLPNQLLEIANVCEVMPFLENHIV